MQNAVAQGGFSATWNRLWAEVGAQTGMFLEHFACLVYGLYERLRFLVQPPKD